MDPGSLALIADSGHMVSDADALLLGSVAHRIARRPADRKRTYGFHRVRELAALANVRLSSCWSPELPGEAIVRVRAPADVMGGCLWSR